jgi:hypothetical protein
MVKRLKILLKVEDPEEINLLSYQEQVKVGRLIEE